MSQLAVIQVVMGLILELISIRAACEVLEMRSNLAYVLLHLGCFVLSYAMRALDIRSDLAVVAIAVFTYIVLPVALSRGSLLTRILRMSLINIGVITSEAFGNMFYALIGGDLTYGPVMFSDESAVPVTIVYCMLIPTSAIVTEIIIAVCKSFDRHIDANVELPVILLMTIPFLLYLPLMLRIVSDNKENGIIPLMCSIYMFSSLFVALALLVVARKGGEAQRELANHAAATRQDRHVRGEVEASVRRTMGMSRLRHDLANQVEVVERLATQGNYADADHYLEFLQLQAKALIGDNHE